MSKKLFTGPFKPGEDYKYNPPWPKTKPSAVAMRAASRLRILNQELPAMTPEHLQAHAQIIDQETNLPELLEVLKHLLPIITDLACSRPVGDIHELMDAARAVIAKAEGREGT